MSLRFYTKKLFIILFIMLCAAAFFTISSGSLCAQSVSKSNKNKNVGTYYDPSDYQQWKDNFKETPVEDIVFSKNKEGCARKMIFTDMLLKKYKNGDDVSDLLNTPLLGRYMREQYNKIRQDGIFKTEKGIMLGYRECMKNAKVEEDPSKEYDLGVRYGMCNTLNTILLDTIKSIKKGKSVDSVLKRYKNKFPDFSDTLFLDMRDPSLMIVLLYKIAHDSQGLSEEEKYEKIYSQASQFVIKCAL